MDDLYSKVEQLLKSLLSIKTNANKDFFVPAIKTPSFKLKPPKVNSGNKIPSGLPPPSKKDPKKVAEQLKNPNPGKVNVEVLKVEDNGQWSLSKAVNPNPKVPSPIDANTEGFSNQHSPEQKKLIHGLDINSARPIGGVGATVAGAASRATNPGLNKDVILKRASQHANRQERGHLDNGFDSSKREVLFHNLARDYFGMGKHVPTTAGFTRNGENYSAQEVKNAVHPDLADGDDDILASASGVLNMKHPGHADILKRLHSSGDLHKLALMDNIMGHHDRHSGNYMMDEKPSAGKDDLHLIDNGGAFDYGNYDTKHYPGYMERAEDSNITGLGLDNSKVHPEAAKWLSSLDPAKAKEYLAAHGHNENSPTTQGLLRRLQGLKNKVNNGEYKNMEELLGNNRLTTGPLYKHPEKAPAW